jgi:hypothetical protein
VCAASLGAGVGFTFLAGCLAVLFWFALKLAATLWMYFLWMQVFGLYIAATLCGVSATRLTTSFWQDVLVTLLILLGPAVEDSATGSDVYGRFVVRMSLFVAVTLDAWTAIELLERLRGRRVRLTPGTAC